MCAKAFGLFAVFSHAPKETNVLSLGFWKLQKLSQKRQKY